MADTNAGWFPTLGGTPKAIADEPERHHHSEPTRRRRHQPDEDTERPDRPRPAVVEPRTRTLDIAQKSVRTPERTVEVAGEAINADRTINIRASPNGIATADITLYNVDVATWGNITTDDEITVRLGWTGTTPSPVFRGNVSTKSRGSRGADSEFTIRAMANGGEVLKSEDYSRTFNDLSPHRIIEYVIEDVGLGRGYVSTLSEKIDGYYSLTQHKSLRRWLDDLAERAANQTGLRWVWYVENEDLHFHPAVERTTQPIEFSTEKSLLRATPVGNPRNGRNHPHEIALRCEPVIERGLAIELDGVAEVTKGRRYRVKSYVHESSTVNQHHYTLATVTPLIERSEVYNDRRA